MILETGVVDFKLATCLAGECEDDKTIGWEFETIECHILYFIHAKIRRGRVDTFKVPVMDNFMLFAFTPVVSSVWVESPRELVQEATATILIKVQFAQHLWRFVPDPRSRSILAICWVIQGLEENTRHKFDDEVLGKKTENKGTKVLETKMDGDVGDIEIYHNFRRVPNNRALQPVATPAAVNRAPFGGWVLRMCLTAVRNWFIYPAV
jgi:hypothetical protein